MTIGRQLVCAPVFGCGCWETLRANAAVGRPKNVQQENRSGYQSAAAAAGPCRRRKRVRASSIPPPRRWRRRRRDGAEATVYRGRLPRWDVRKTTRARVPCLGVCVCLGVYVCKYLRANMRVCEFASVQDVCAMTRAVVGDKNGPTVSCWWPSSRRESFTGRARAPNVVTCCHRQRSTVRRWNPSLKVKEPQWRRSLRL